MLPQRWLRRASLECVPVNTHSDYVLGQQLLEGYSQDGQYHPYRSVGCPAQGVMTDSRARPFWFKSCLCPFDPVISSLCTLVSFLKTWGY